MPLLRGIEWVVGVVLSRGGSRGQGLQAAPLRHRSGQNGPSKGTRGLRRRNALFERMGMWRNRYRASFYRSYPKRLKGVLYCIT